MKSFVVHLLGLLLTTTIRAYDADSSWPSGTRNFQLRLTNATTQKNLPSGGLADGSASWNAVAENAIAVWNAQLSRIQITTTTASGDPVQSDGINQIGFSSTAFGTEFGERTLAVAFRNWEPSINRIRIREADILVNSAISWDSYRGPGRAAVDLRRVLIHELGHAIGLNHPDQAHPPQTVTAIMNSSISSIDTLTEDDIEGARALYQNPITVPSFTRQPVGGTFRETESADIFVETSTGTPPSSPTLSYSWLFRRTGAASSEWLFGQPEAKIPLGTVQSYDAGTYQLVIETPDGNTTSNSVSLSVTPTATSSGTRFYNLSTRGVVEDGEKSLIFGFVVQTATQRRVLIRGIGPGLGRIGFTTTLADPQMSVHRLTDDTLIASNDDWSSAGSGATDSLFSTAGAFALTPGSKDAAIVLDLPAGNYTATLTSKAGTSPGIGLVEIYDLSTAQSPTERLYNLSTRGYVGKGAENLVAGVAIRGPGPRTVLLRAAGDTLQQFNLSETLDDPTLRLFDAAQKELRFTDDWDSPEDLQDTLRAVMQRVGAFAFTDRQESALLLKLQPGNYTLQVAGFDGGAGVAIVELYEVDE